MQRIQLPGRGLAQRCERGHEPRLRDETARPRAANLHARPRPLASPHGRVGGQQTSERNNAAIHPRRVTLQAVTHAQNQRSWVARVAEELRPRTVRCRGVLEECTFATLSEWREGLREAVDSTRANEQPARSTLCPLARFLGSVRESALRSA